jgi:hypothetical protein
MKPGNSGMTRTQFKLVFTNFHRLNRLVVNAPILVATEYFSNPKIDIQLSKKFPARPPGTRFTNANSCFEPGPQEPYRDIFLKDHEVSATQESIFFN